MKLSDLPAYERALVERALRPARTSSQMMLRVHAVDEAIRDGHPMPWELVKERLEEAVADPFGSYAGARAARMAMKCLAILNGETDEDVVSDTPERRVTADYWPGPANPFSELDAYDTEGERDGWRRRLEGDPPWPRTS